MATASAASPDRPARETSEVEVTMLGEIGHGAQAVVHRVRRGDTEYAMKVLRLTGLDDEEQARGFRREAALLACVDDPGLARVHEVGSTAGGRPYLLMDLVDGERLSVLIGGGPMDGDRAAALGVDLASALAAAHAAGLVHRDVKPDNIMVTAQGAARLIDFGLAVRVDGDEDGGDQVAGTLAYSAPEQSGMLRRPVDGRGDLYALGAVLFECVTGRTPYSASDVGELMRLHAVAPVPDPRVQVPALSATLAAIIVRLLAKDPDDRYQSGDGLLADLRRFLAEPGVDFTIGENDPVVSVRQVALIGRDAELAALRRHWERARAGHGGVVTVRGAPGSGKSRLARELAAEVRAAGRPVLNGRSSPDERQPLAALRAAVDDHVRAMLRTGTPAATALLRAAAGPGAALVKNLSTALAGVLAVPDIDGEVGQDRYAGAVAAFLTGLARAGGPMLMHVDDAQWFDEGTALVLRLLAVEAADVPLLVVVTARDDPTLDGAGAEAEERDVRLAPLTPPSVAALVAALTGLRVADDVAAALAARSGGSPFTVVEYVKAIVDAGLARPAWGRWHVDLAGLGDLRLPADAAELVLARLDTLDAQSRQLLGVAAVVGPTFAADVVAEAAGVDPRRVHEVIAEGTRQGLIEPRAAGHGFLHERIRAALTGQIAPDRRRDLHHRIAEALDSRADDRDVYALAQHCAAGDPGHQPARTLRAARVAGERALADHAPAAALFFLECAAGAARAGGLATDSGFDRLLGTAYQRSGRFDDALVTLRRGLQGTADRRERVRILHLIAQVHDSTWRGAEQAAAAEQGLAELGRPTPRNRFLLVLSSVWLFVVGCLIGLTRLGYGTARGDRREAYRLQADMCHHAGGGNMRALRMVEAAMYGLRIIHPISRLGRSPERARDLNALSMLLAMAGLHRVAGRISRSAARLAEDLGDPVLAGYVEWIAAITAHSSGRDSGERIHRLLVEQLRWLDTGHILDCYAALGWDWLLRGDMAEADANLARRQRWIDAGGQSQRSAVVGVDAGLLALRGRPGESAVRISEAAGDATALHERVDLLIARLYLAVESDDLLDAFDATVAEFDALGLTSLQLFPAQHLYFVVLAHGRLEQARRATGPPRAAAVARAARAVSALRRVARRPLVVAHHRVAAAALALLRCAEAGTDSIEESRVGAQRALGQLDAAAPLLHAVDAPLVAYERGVVRARALLALGVTGEADWQARGALLIAETQGWPQRSRRLAAEFQLGAAVSLRLPRGTSVPGGQHLRRWAALEQVSLAASRVLDPVRLARIVLDETTRILGAERAFLFLIDASTGNLVPQVGRDAAGHDLPEVTGYSASLVHRVRHSREPLVVTGTEEGEALGARSAVVYGLRSILVAPLQLDDRLLGVVYLDSRVAKGVFTVDDVDLLTAVTHHVAVAMETARAAQLEVAVATANRQRDLAETLRQAMARLSDTLDPELVLRRLLETAVDTPGAVRGWLLLGAPDDPQVRVLSGSDEARSLPATAVGGVLADEEAQVRSGAPPFATGSAPPFATGSGQGWVSVPLRTRDAALGALVLAVDRPQAYTDADLGLVAALVGQGMVAYENALLFSRVNELAVTDSLTGVANRRRFFEAARAELARARLTGAPLSAIMVDIDHFKRVNDTRGHQAGDDVIRVVAARLREICPASGMLARYGGEEFVVLLPGEGAEPAVVAEALRAAVGSAPVETRDGPVAVTISLGLAGLRPADGTADALLARADAALYQAKQAGRNRVVAHSEPDAGAASPGVP